jgi:hypothetical protein
MFLKMLFIINKIYVKVPDLITLVKIYMLLDPHVPMLKGWVVPSSFPRIMSLKVVLDAGVPL